MRRLQNEATVSKITVFGLLSHYIYSILLYLSSQLKEEISLPISICYILVASLPGIILCSLVLVKDRDLQRSIFGNKHMRIVRDELFRS